MPRTSEEQSISAQQACTYLRLRRLVLDKNFRAEFNDLARCVRANTDALEQLRIICDFQNRWQVQCLVRHPEIFDLELTNETIPDFLAKVSRDLTDVRLLAHFIRAQVQKVLRELRKLGYRVPRWRLDSVLKHFRTYDLKRKRTGDEVAALLWPEEWKNDGGRDVDTGEKSYLIQRVYDQEKAARKLLYGSF